MSLENKIKKVFLICPVKDVTPEQRTFLDNYVAELESNGYKVHYPHRDTDQSDPIGLEICTTNMNAIKNADEVHIYWTNKTRGGVFDFGMAFMAGKPLKLVNPKEVERPKYKTFETVLHVLHEKYALK